MAQWTNEPWGRQKDEGEKAYEAFVLYRNMGQGRTISAVVKKLGKSRSLIDRWKDKWKWGERVRAYDISIEKEARTKAIKEHKAMVERHINIAMQLQKKALEALKTLDVADMTFKDIKEYVKVATELERLNRMLDEEEKQKKVITPIVINGEDKLE